MADGTVDGEHGPPMDAGALTKHSRRPAQKILPAYDPGAVPWYDGRRELPVEAG